MRQSENRFVQMQSAQRIGSKIKDVQLKKRKREREREMLLAVHSLRRVSYHLKKAYFEHWTLRAIRYDWHLHTWSHSHLLFHMRWKRKPFPPFSFFSSSPAFYTSSPLIEIFLSLWLIYVRKNSTILHARLKWWVQNSLWLTCTCCMCLDDCLMQQQHQPCLFILILICNSYPTLLPPPPPLKLCGMDLM